MEHENVTTASPEATTSPKRLIASDRVEGTAVYNRDGEKLGSIERFMVDKRSGQAEYAVLSFGGLFGMGHKHHPLPWAVLDYDPEKEGYVVDLDKAKLEGGPSYEGDAEPEYDREYGERARNYYGLTT